KPLHTSRSPPRRPPPPSPLSPYTTLFRSLNQDEKDHPMHIPVTDQISLTEFHPSDKATCVERIGDRDIYDRTLRIPHPYTEEHRSEEHTSELQSRENLVCRLLLEKKNQTR